MGKEMIVDTEYAGYVFVGWAAGRFKTERGEMMPYANMFVLSPVSSYESDDYQAMGMKAEKPALTGPSALTVPALWIGYSTTARAIS